MPIDRINFSTSQENVNRIGLRSWKKFGARYTLEPGEDKSEARKALKDFVYESLKKQLEELPENTAAETKEAVLVQKPLTQQERIAQAIADIYTCTSLVVLEAVYKKLSNNYPEIKAAYEQQELKLKNQ